MFKSFMEVEKMFDNLKSQHMAYLHSFSLEMKNVRLNTDMVAARYCRQLSRVKSDRNDIHKLLCPKFKVQKMDSQNQILIVEGEENKILRAEIVCTINENTHITYDIQSEYDTSKITCEKQQTNMQLNDKTLNLKETMVDVNDMINQLENYLSTIVKTITTNY